MATNIALTLSGVRKKCRTLNKLLTLIKNSNMILDMIKRRSRATRNSTMKLPTWLTCTWFPTLRSNGGPWSKGFVIHWGWGSCLCSQVWLCCAIALISSLSEVSMVWEIWSQQLWGYSWLHLRPRPNTP